MKEKMTWFWNWEKSIWGDKIETNRYFATLSIMFVAVMGVFCGSGDTLRSWFDWDTAISNLVACGMLIFIWGLNVCESIMASMSASAMLGRSLMLLAVLVAAFFIGYVASVIVLFLVATWVVLTFASGMVSGALNGGSSPSGSANSGPEQYGYDENGSQVVIRNEGGGYGRDDYGRRWKNEGGSKGSKDE